MKIIREFSPTDRYEFDFGVCSPKKGFAQVDTEQDASYYGTWASPYKLMIVNYAEGDITTQQADTPKEFAEALRSLKKWNEDFGYKFRGIDPGFDNKLRAKFDSFGLSDLLH